MVAHARSGVFVFVVKRYRRAGMVVLHLVQALLIHYGAVMSKERKAARGSAMRRLGSGFGEEGWLASLLRDATGVDDVVPETRP